MKVLRFIRAMAIVSGLACFTTPVFAQQAVTVDCGAGESIQAVLDAFGGSAELLEITVTGTCVEDVLIARDSVSLIGNNGATLVGRLNVRGAIRIGVSDMTLTGGSAEGIRVGLGYIRALRITVSDYGGPGILAPNGGNVILIGSRVANNGGDGITAQQGSRVRLNGTVVEGNGRSGIYALTGSSAHIIDSVISANTQLGIFVGIGSSLYAVNSDFTGNETGIVLATNSSAVLEGGTAIEGNYDGITIKQHSFVEFDTTSVSNNARYGIEVKEDAAAFLSGSGNVVAGNGGYGVFCPDTESSFYNEGPDLADPVECTGFDQAARHPPKKGK